MQGIERDEVAAVRLQRSARRAAGRVSNQRQLAVRTLDADGRGRYAFLIEQGVERGRNGLTFRGGIDRSGERTQLESVVFENVDMGHVWLPE
ncbi:hypothetical protein D3C72_2069130 [compost metagenome]